MLQALPSSDTTHSVDLVEWILSRISWSEKLNNDFYTWRIFITTWANIISEMFWNTCDIWINLASYLYFRCLSNINVSLGCNYGWNDNLSKLVCDYFLINQIVQLLLLCPFENMFLLLFIFLKKSCIKRNYLCTGSGSYSFFIFPLPFEPFWTCMNIELNAPTNEKLEWGGNSVHRCTSFARYRLEKWIN